MFFICLHHMLLDRFGNFLFAYHGECERIFTLLTTDPLIFLIHE